MITSRLGLAALLLMVIVPFLIPVHTTPIPSFHPEWVAACLGLAASVALIGAPRMPLPGAALLALALAAFALLQLAVGRAPVPQLTTLFVLYLLWAALLACTASHLATVFGQARLAAAIAMAVLLGASLAALASLLQPWLQDLGWRGFNAPTGGPLGQRNHLTSYLWLGIASALYLRMTAKINRPVFWATVMLLTMTAVMVGQRTSFLYAAALIAVSFWTTRTQDSATLKDARRMAFGVGLVFVALQPMPYLLPQPNPDATNPPPALRATQQAGGPSIRMQLFRVGVMGIMDAPFLGNGIGSYPGLSLSHANDIAPADNPGPAEHAHDIFVDISTELGVPAALLLLFGAWYWLKHLPRRTDPSEANWATAMFAILGLHSLIEYSLWHTYFLGLLVIIAGAFGIKREIGKRFTPVALTIGLLVWGGLNLWELKRDYTLLENALAQGNQALTQPLAKASLLRIPSSSLLSPWVNTTACVSADSLSVSVADGLAVCHIAMRFAPTVESVVRMAVLQWRAGDIEGARKLLRALRQSSNYDPDGTDNALAPLKTRDSRIGDL